ncbi:MAG: flagellar hook-associated protein 3 [Glaciihabitans sp.]|nr:flagellar hook-associated protein 3 [Glaciihabitans sp.]
MITRVTGFTMMTSASRNMQLAAAELARVQEAASTLKNITRPSDDPAGTVNAIRVRAEQQANAQFTRNTADGNEWLTTIDSALSSTSNLLQRANILTIRAANDGSMTPVAREAIAVELETIRDSLLGVANTQYNGRSVFAGNSSTGTAFSADYTYSGDGSTVMRRIGSDTQVRVDADGETIFGDANAAGTSVFDELNAIITSVRAADGGTTDIGQHITTLATRMATVTGQQAVAGARQATLISAAEAQLDTKVTLEARRSSIEDIDLGEIILELKMQETVYQASLAITARALQPSLMDFLR